MASTTCVFKSVFSPENGKLIVASLLIGFLSAVLALTLKHLTNHYENILFGQSQTHLWYLLVFPAIGLSVIYFLRQYLFKKRANKGITEIFESIQTGKKMPIYKIPSHFINGFLTIIFGRSTGIEVSTVVASATIGSVAQQKKSLFRLYKTELISAGVAAGVAALFCSPVATLPSMLVLAMLAVLVLKPLITSITLASGGDGGVFAPSLFIGAFLGFLTATVFNTFFNANVIPVNFIIIGMAAMLSASIHVPFTALFLVCALVDDYAFFAPILAICLISKKAAQFIYLFTVYTYVPQNTK